MGTFQKAPYGLASKINFKDLSWSWKFFYQNWYSENIPTHFLPHHFNIRVMKSKNLSYIQKTEKSFFFLASIRFDYHKFVQLRRYKWKKYFKMFEIHLIYGFWNCLRFIIETCYNWQHVQSLLERVGLYPKNAVVRKL